MEMASTSAGMRYLQDRENECDSADAKWAEVQDSAAGAHEAVPLLASRAGALRVRLLDLAAAAEGLSNARGDLVQLQEQLQSGALLVDKCERLAEKMAVEAQRAESLRTPNPQPTG
eukprot:Hpha_TRINITY_DN21562_c0_g1::TRINITY_DN21562_c0_g1_i1::g.55::m.55